MTQPITVAELRARVAAEAFTGAKYGNKSSSYVAELDRTFQSKHEADQAVLLHRRQQNGEVRNIRFQVPFDLVVNGVLVCTYVSDFCFEEKHTPVKATDPLPGPVVEAELGTGAVWVSVVADAKSAPTRTPLYRLKAKLLLALRGIRIVEL